MICRNPSPRLVSVAWEAFHQSLARSRVKFYYCKTLFARSVPWGLQSQRDPIVARSHQKLSAEFDEVRGATTGAGTAGSGCFKLAFTTGGFTVRVKLRCVAPHGL